MLRDITIGQHFPGNSVLHRCDPRLKLVATIAYIVVLFVAPNPLGLALSIALLAALYKVAKIPGKLILKSLKPIVPIVLFTAVLNLFFVTGEGEPLVHIWVLKIYGEGIRYAILHDGARLCIDRRYEPSDLHHQPHRADGRDRESAAPAGENSFPGA